MFVDPSLIACASADIVLQMIEENVNMKSKVEVVLDETENTENRAAKMSVDDLLKCVS